jgi:hypothetical protein
LNTTVTQRATLLRAAAALFGFSAAVSFHDLLLRPAPAGQLPGLMTSLGYDAGSSFRFIALIVLLPMVLAFGARPVAELLARDDVERWTRNAAILAAVGALWTVMLARDPLWVIGPAAFVIAAACLLRHYRADFRRADTVLIPAAAALFIALQDMTDMGVDRAVIVSAILVLTVRVAISAIRRDRAPDTALCFALAPLALIPETHFFARDQRHLGWPAVAIVMLTPIVLRLVLPADDRWQRRLRFAAAWIIYPIACYAYISATGLLAAEGKPRASLFEDGQHVVAAAEMMRGERAYRDIIPPHGFGQDALLDYVVMRRGAGTLGKVLKGRGTISGVTAIAQYALGTAITGSAAGGLLTFFVGATLGLGGFFRVLPALLTLAIALHAIRKRQPRLFAYAGVGVVLSFMTSLDFGAYAAAALSVAVFRFTGQRRDAIRQSLIGAAVAATLTAIALAAGGILMPFVRVTLAIPSLGPIYALTPFEAPEILKTTHFIPDIIATIFDPSALLYLLWVALLIFLAVAVSSRPQPMSMRRRSRLESLVVIAAFAVVCAISYAERHHLYHQFIVPTMLVGVTMAVAGARNRTLRLAAPFLAILILATAHPTRHLGIVAWLRHQRGPVEPEWREVADVPRARGALFRGADAGTVEIIGRYQASHLGPGETYFDFTNRGLLYYLFDRDCPVPYIEVAFYEPEARQREVISAIANNPRIRAVLVPPPNDDTGVDGVPNSVRAPLVWRYLQTHFTPDFADGQVVFWKRTRW